MDIKMEEKWRTVCILGVTRYVAEKGVLPTQVVEKNDTRVMRLFSSQSWAYEIIKRTGAKAAELEQCVSLSELAYPALIIGLTNMLEVCEVSYSQ
jgi:hypothetical protein